MAQSSLSDNPSETGWLVALLVPEESVAFISPGRVCYERMLLALALRKRPSR
jgi:hypothetical protein